MIAVTVARLEAPIDPTEAKAMFTIDQESPEYSGGQGEEVEAFNEHDREPEIFNLYGNEEDGEGDDFWN